MLRTLAENLQSSKLSLSFDDIKDCPWIFLQSSETLKKFFSSSSFLKDEKDSRYLLYISLEMSLNREPVIRKDMVF